MAASRILYVLTQFSAPSGGIRVLFEHVSVLRNAGYDAFIFAPEFSEIEKSFNIDVPVLIGAGHALRRSDIIIRPETSFSHGIAQVGRRMRQILFVQNHFYIRHCLGNYRRVADLGIEQVICGSRGIKRFLAEHVAVPNATIIPYAVPKAISSTAKSLSVAYMPRKRGQEAEIIRHLVSLMRPDLANIPWVKIDGFSYEDSLKTLAQSAVFLSLQRFEGFGLPAIEAMAAGCLVAGFSGVSTSDYAHSKNGWWVPDEDIESAARALCFALTEARDNTPLAKARLRAGKATAYQYSEKARDTALLEFFESLIDPIS